VLGPARFGVVGARGYGGKLKIDRCAGAGEVGDGGSHTLGDGGRFLAWVAEAVPFFSVRGQVESCSHLYFLLLFFSMRSGWGHDM
jgi:hypothetical protein